MRPASAASRALAATQANQLYSWDITYLPVQLCDTFFCWRIGTTARIATVRLALSPDQCHAGQDQALLSARAQVYKKVRQANPLRWSRQIRDCSYVNTVHLYPDTPEDKDPQTIPKAA